MISLSGIKNYFFNVFSGTNVLALVMCVFLMSSATGQEVVNITTVRDNILLVELSEGAMQYGGVNDPVTQIKIETYGLLDTNRASQVNSYILTSDADSQYGAKGLHPLHVGRKSKGAYFHKDLYVYNNGGRTFLSHHWLYLLLSHPLQSGNKYTLSLSGLTRVNKPHDFVFDPYKLVSPVIHLNQLGFRPHALKYGYISQFMGDFDAAPHLQGGLNLDDYGSAPFHIVDTRDHRIVFSGKLTVQQPAHNPDMACDSYAPTRNLSHADVWQADFSTFQTPGTYRLVVERLGCSLPFTIHADVFRQAYVAAMRGLFFQRAGIEHEVREWDKLIYPADYIDNNMYYNSDAGREESGAVRDRKHPIKGVWGWYHDAGDWDGYARHTAVPATLLLAYEIAPRKFRDGDIGNRWRRSPAEAWHDEGTNGIPDILDEAGWLLAYNRRARQAVKAAGYGSGGVPAYVGIDGCGDANASWLDKRDLVLHGEDVKLTAEQAGLAAWYGAALRQAGRPAMEIQEWLDEARDAYAWADAHNGMQGEEGWLANVGLYRATGEAIYQQRFLERFKTDANWEYWTSAEARQFALLLYTLLPADHPNLDKNRQIQLRGLVRQQADNFWMREGLKRGFRATHIAPWQRNCLGIFSTPRTLFLQVVFCFSGEVEYDAATQFAADYTLGGNQQNLIWMSGLGAGSDMAIFHPDSWVLPRKDHALRGQQPLPGLTAYGSHFTFDWFGANYQHSGSEDFSRSTAYPVIWKKTGNSHAGQGPAWAARHEIPGWAPPDSIGDGPGNRSLFPPAEGRFANRWSIPGSEFTVNQNLCHNAFTYGLLIAEPKINRVAE